MHVSLRLGPFADAGEEDSGDHLTLAELSKAAGKRKMASSQARKRSGNSPTQGQTVKKRRVTKCHPSPKRKLMLDAFAAGGRGSTKAAKAPTTRKAPTTKLFPPSMKKGKDFRLLPQPLP